MPQLTWAQCRAAAASLRDAELFGEVITLLRPRGPLGVLRGRGPLSLLLYVAAADGRLVWRGPDSLALLQPPADAPMGRGRPVLRLLVRQWDVLVFTVPPAVLLLIALLAALLHTATGARVLLWIVLAAVLATLVHVTVLLGCGVATGIVFFVREFARRPAEDDVAAELLPGRSWSVVLCHHVDGSRPRLLLRLVQQRLSDLLLAGTERAAADQGVRVTVAQVTEELICLRRGITTTAMRDAVAAWSARDGVFEPGAAVTVRLSEFRALRAPVRIFDRGGFLLWYVAGEIVVLAVLSRLVPGWERAACHTVCAGHPVTSGSAVHWLLQRLLLTDPYGLGPAGRAAWIVGWLVSLMSLMGLFVAIAAVQQYVRYRRAVLARALEKVKRLNDRSRTLIMVATRAERDAVIAAVHAVNGCEPEITYLPHQAVLRLGPISRTTLLLAQVEPGTIGLGAAGIAAAALVSRLDLDFLILAGICFGLKPADPELAWRGRPGDQQLADILVGDQLRAVDHRKETDEPDGSRTVLIRGDYVTPSPALLGRLHAVEQSWSRPPAVHFGPLLSANVLVNSRSLRDEICEQQREAIGGEMEGAGVYAAAAHAKVDWIVVKAVCDWGFDKSDDFHAAAARNAAAFVVHAAEEGALDDPPARGSI